MGAKMPAWTQICSIFCSQADALSQKVDELKRGRGAVLGMRGNADICSMQRITSCTPTRPFWIGELRKYLPGKAQVHPAMNALKVCMLNYLTRPVPIDQHNMSTPVDTLQCTKTSAY
eukprot:1151996-Pelagomonas_calceolata.AAC.5